MPRVTRRPLALAAALIVSGLAACGEGPYESSDAATRFVRTLLAHEVAKKAADGQALEQSAGESHGQITAAQLAAAWRAAARRLEAEPSRTTCTKSAEHKYMCTGRATLDVAGQSVTLEVHYRVTVSESGSRIEAKKEGSRVY